MLSDGIWKRLARRPDDRPGFTALRLCPASRFNLFAAVDESARRVLLLKSSDAQLSLPKPPYPAGRGFTTQCSTTAGDPDGAKSIRLELTDPAFADVFDVIGNDILANVVRCDDDTSAFTSFIGRIEVWQQFLDELPNEGLGEQRQLGLFGELWFLNRFLLDEVGPQRAIRSWGGPQALAKDFQFPGLSFEVKASTAKQHAKFYISNEMQLDAREGRLILFGLLLEKVAAGGTSLPELVATLRERLFGSDSGSALSFGEMLLKAGYRDADTGAAPARFELRSESFFDVGDDFPRIVESDLRPGVGDVRYSVLPSKCERHSISEAQVLGLLRGAR